MCSTSQLSLSLRERLPKGFELLKSLAADIVLNPAGVLLGCFRIFSLVTSQQNAKPALAASNHRLMKKPIAQMSIIESLYDGQARLVRHR